MIFSPIKQQYHYEINSTELPEEISDIIHSIACETGCQVDYCDGDFKFPTSYNNLQELLAPFAEEWEDEKEDYVEGTENPFKEFFDSFPIEITAEPSLQFLVGFSH